MFEWLRENGGRLQLLTNESTIQSLFKYVNSISTDFYNSNMNFLTIQALQPKSPSILVVEVLPNF